jgi:formylmethanofuran dehydrogenase subunit E
MYKAELSMARESNKALSTQLAEKDLLINELVFKVPESQANESELNKLRGQLKEALSAQSRLEEEIFEVKVIMRSMNRGFCQYNQPGSE